MQIVNCWYGPCVSLTLCSCFITELQIVYSASPCLSSHLSELKENSMTSTQSESWSQSGMGTIGLTMSPGPSPLRRVRAWGWGCLGMRHWWQIPEYCNRFNLDDDACHIPSRDSSVHWHITDASYRIVAGWIQVKNILRFLIPGSTQTRYWINASLVLF